MEMLILLISTYTKDVSYFQAMGEEISPFIIEALVKSSITEVDVQQLKKAADAARAASKSR